MARLLLARHYEVPCGSPIFSTQSTASELICAEVDGSAALRAEAVHNGRFHVLSWPNRHFKPHTSPFKSVNRISWRDGSVGWRVVAGSALHTIRGRSSGCENTVRLNDQPCPGGIAAIQRPSIGQFRLEKEVIYPS